MSYAAPKTRFVPYAAGASVRGYGSASYPTDVRRCMSCWMTATNRYRLTRRIKMGSVSLASPSTSCEFRIAAPPTPCNRRVGISPTTLFQPMRHHGRRQFSIPVRGRLYVGCRDGVRDIWQSVPLQGPGA